MSQTKRQLLRSIKRETRPPRGFGQWLLILEQRRLSEEVGLFRLEAQLDGKIQCSGAVSVNLPENKKFDSNGKEIPGDWDKVAPGKSLFNVVTLETRGKSLMETATGWLKRSVEEGKLQDLLPFVRWG